MTFTCHPSAVPSRLNLVASTKSYKGGHWSLSDFAVMAWIGESGSTNRKFKLSVRYPLGEQIRFICPGLGCCCCFLLGAKLVEK